MTGGGRMEIILIVASYLFGSLSPARIVGKAKGVDLTANGTQNPGATNVYKLIGTGWGVAVAFMDLFKGMIPAIIARIYFNTNPLVLLLTGVGVVAGHNWPLYYGFKGGRGLASSLGVFCVFNFRLILFTFIISLGISAYLKKKYGERVRIPFSLYPLLILSNIFFLRNWFLLLYTIVLMAIALFRAWQVRHKLQDKEDNI
mgnify:CR=1 FL=1